MIQVEGTKRGRLRLEITLVEVVKEVLIKNKKLVEAVKEDM